MTPAIAAGTVINAVVAIRVALRRLIHWRLCVLRYAVSSIVEIVAWHAAGVYCIASYCYCWNVLYVVLEKVLWV